MTAQSIFTVPSICEREGHVQSRDISLVPAWPFCKDCGAKNTSQCLSCDAVIHGTMGRHPGPYNPPSFCHECGAGYPWTARRIRSAQQVILESDSSPEAKDVANSLPDLVTPSEGSNSAIARVKFWMARAAPTVARAIWELMWPIISAEARAKLGIPPSQ